ncbi:MAG: hypothetical protein K0S93_1387, partial [Nitrososphaeraceae archaeon]|nr:hypothetical protein [Nitrososphaeraceae archaeon]
ESYGKDKDDESRDHDNDYDNDDKNHMEKIKMMTNLKIVAVVVSA